MASHMNDIGFLRHPAIDSLGRQLGFSVLVSLVVAIQGAVGALAFLPPAEAWTTFGTAWLTGIVILCEMLLIVSLAHPHLAQGGWLRWIGLIGIAVAAGVAGFVLNIAFESFENFDGPSWLNSKLALALLLVGIREFAYRRQRAAEALDDAELKRLSLHGELAASRLNVLHAQIEPHFLFNSLANVRRLLRTDANAAHVMLADLLRYLEEALPRLREEQTTLASEVELARAFLAVHRVRMGERLRFDIDVPPELADRHVPPMLLLTLIENALKHGLQPLVEGGCVHVTAEAAWGGLTLTVADTGRGMGSGSGHGTGLANVRARLKAMYGSSASLSLSVNDPKGVVATITLPEETA